QQTESSASNQLSLSSRHSSAPRTHLPCGSTSQSLAKAARPSADISCRSCSDKDSKSTRRSPAATDNPVRRPCARDNQTLPVRSLHGSTSGTTNPATASHVSNRPTSPALPERTHRARHTLSRRACPCSCLRGHTTTRYQLRRQDAC